MLKNMNRARWIISSASLVCAPLFSGCDVKEELLAPQNPGVIDPSAVTSPAAAAGLRVAALGQLKNRTAGSESVWLYGGLLADEWKSSDTFSQRNETDQRSIQTNNSNITPAYNALQQARGYTRTAIEKSMQYSPDSKGRHRRDVVHARVPRDDVGREFLQRYSTRRIRSMESSQYGPPLTNDSIYKMALTHYDSALALAVGTDAKSVSGKAGRAHRQGAHAAQSRASAAAGPLVSTTACSNELCVHADLRPDDRRQQHLVAEQQHRSLHGR